MVSDSYHLFHLLLITLNGGGGGGVVRIWYNQCVLHVIQVEEVWDIGDKV